MIYTSYFANLKNLPDNVEPISICGKALEWYGGFQYKKLAPKYDFFMKWKQDHDNEAYTKAFKEQVLSRLKADVVLFELRKIVGSNRDIALICYEKPSDFCHRHLVAEWLRENGVDCCEFIGE